MSKMAYSLGALVDPIDTRDYKIANYMAPIAIPRKLDLTDLMLSVRDQGQEGACVAFASAAVKESEEQDGTHLSPRFLYERIKQPGGGSYPRDAMKVLLDTGIPPETCQPYMDNKPTAPCIQVMEFAKRNKIRGYARLNTLDEMKQCLYQNGAFIIAMAITKDWFNVESDGVLKDGGARIGYHAITFVGYDDELQRVKIKNSWGQFWGDGGYGYIGYNMLMNNITDAWSSIDIPEKEEEGYVEPKPEPQPEPMPEPQPEPMPEPQPVPKPDPVNPQPEPSGWLKRLINFLRALLGIKA